MVQIDISKRNENARLSGLRSYADRKMGERITKIQMYCDDNPGYTRTKIAKHLGESHTFIHRVFREHDVDIDMVQLYENEKKDSLVNRKAIGVRVVTPDGSIYSFESVNNARRKLERDYGEKFPDSSVRRCMNQGRAYKGFTFRNDCH